jgi:hypothetical protein
MLLEPIVPLACFIMRPVSLTPANQGAVITVQ